MKKSNFTDEQIAYALQRHEAGTPMSEISTKLSYGQWRPGRISR